MNALTNVSNYTSSDRRYALRTKRVSAVEWISISFNCCSCRADKMILLLKLMLPLLMVMLLTFVICVFVVFCILHLVSVFTNIVASTAIIKACPKLRRLIARGCRKLNQQQLLSSITKTSNLSLILE